MYSSRFVSASTHNTDNNVVEIALIFPNLLFYVYTTGIILEVATQIFQSITPFRFFVIQYYIHGFWIITGTYRVLRELNFTSHV